MARGNDTDTLEDGTRPLRGVRHACRPDAQAASQPPRTDVLLAHMLEPALPPVPRSLRVGCATNSRTAAPVMPRREIHIVDERAKTRFRAVQVHEQTNHPLATRDASGVTVIL